MSLTRTVLRVSLLANVIATVVCVPAAHGAPIAYDDFSYTAGSSLVGQNGGYGWAGAWYQGGYNASQAVNVVANGPLSYPSLLTTGNQATAVATSLINGVERDLASPISSGTVYMSFLIEPLGTLNQGNENGFFGVYLHGSANDVFVGASGTSNYTVQQRGGIGSVLTPDAPVVGQTEFLVLKAQLFTSGNDIFTLYNNPTPGALEPSSGAVMQDISIGTLSGLVIYSGGAFSIGNLRLGTTYADVTPLAQPPLSWNQPGGGAWNTVATNQPWLGSGGSAAAFSNASGVAFNLGGANPIAVDAGGVQPALMAFAATAGSYSFTGGPIAGPGSLTMSGGTVTLGNANTYSGGTNLLAGLLNVNNGSPAVATSSAIGTGVLVISGGSLGNTSGGDVTLGTSNAQIWNGNFTYVGSGNNLNLGTGAVNLSGTSQVTVTANTLGVGGAISGAAGGLIKAGSGTLLLAGSNTYGGGTTISAGTLQLGDGTANNGYLQGNILNNGSLVFANAAAETFAGAISGSGSVIKAGAGRLMLAPGSSYGGVTSVSGGTLQLQPAAPLATGLNPAASFTSDATSGIVSNPAQPYTEALAFHQGSNVTVNGVTFSDAGMTGGTGQQGTTWTFNVSATDSWVDFSGAFASGFPLTSGMGTYALLNHFWYEGAQGTVTLSVQGLTPGAVYDARLYYRAWETVDNRTADFTFNSGGATQTAVVNEDADNGAHYIDYQYVVGSSGVMSISESNDATMQAGGSWHWYSFSNQYLGMASTGGSANTLPTTTTLVVGRGATVDLNGVNQQVLSLSDTSGSGGSLINTSTTAAILTLSPTGGRTTFSGSIQGGGSLGQIGLVINGSGTQVLAGSNTYTGPTAINAGGLVVAGSLGSTAVTVGGGATLGGSGSIAGSVVVLGGSTAGTQGGINLADGMIGTLTLSDSKAADTVLTLGGLTVGNPSAFTFEVGAIADRILVAAGKVLVNPGGSLINIIPLSGFGPGTYDLMDFPTNQASGLGYLSLATTSLPGYTLQLQSTPTAEQLVVAVPEPSTVALLSVGALGLLGYAWRRRVASASQEKDSPAAASRPTRPPAPDLGGSGPMGRKEWANARASVSGGDGDGPSRQPGTPAPRSRLQ